MSPGRTVRARGERRDKVAKTEKTRVMVDVYRDYNGNEYFRIVLADKVAETIYELTGKGDGFFLYSDDVDEYLEEMADELEVVKDYRDKD
jgi:hypothetical protein